MVLACVACLVAFVCDPHDQLAALDAVDLTAWGLLETGPGQSHHSGWPLEWPTYLALNGSWG
ncbi:MAG: hypothetical protein WAO15_22625 [Mycobacterium sp.]